jgi:hypothetical protein
VEQKNEKPSRNAKAFSLAKSVLTEGLDYQRFFTVGSKTSGSKGGRPIDLLAQSGSRQKFLGEI